MHHLRGYLFIAIAAIFWGISATVAKFLFTKAYDPLIIVQMRVTIACCILVTYFAIRNRSILRIQVRDIPMFLFVGICGVAGSNYFYYAAIKESNVALAILLQYLAPILVMLYATFIQKEAITRFKFLALSFSVIGIFFAIGGYNPELLEANRTGVILALLAAVSFSIFNIGGKPLTRKYSVWTTLIFVLMGASLFWIVVNPPQSILRAGYESVDWMNFLLISTISILIPHGCYFFGLHYIQPSRAIITSTLEPVVAIVTEWIFLQGTMTPVQIFGGVLVVGAIVLLQRAPHKEEVIIAQE